MSLVCKTLVLAEDGELLKMIAEAFPPPRYELEFVDSLDEVVAHASSKHTDMLIVDSKFAGGDQMDLVKRNVPTMIVEQEYSVEDSSNNKSSSQEGTAFDAFEEIGKIKSAADKLLHANYINWIVNALEYFPTRMYSDS